MLQNPRNCYHHHCLTCSDISESNHIFENGVQMHKEFHFHERLGNLATH